MTDFTCLTCGLVSVDPDRPTLCRDCRVTVTGRCLCSHHISAHEDQRGECWISMCGCRYYRPKEIAK